MLAGKVRDKSADEVFHGLLRRRVVCGKVLSPADLLDDEHLAARGFFRTLRHPRLGELPFAGPPATLGRTGPAPPAPAPGVCEQIDPSRLDWSPAGRTTPDGGAGEALPLDGVEIVDMTQAWIGPYAAMLLADLVLRRLIADADALMENFTPRVMERFGFDWPAVEKLNPSLVMTSWSGFGKTGPLSDYKANGTSIEALAGWDWLHRYPDGEPMVMGFYQADAITGLQMAATTLVALFHSRRTGEGQSIDGSMVEAAAGYLGELLLDAAIGGEQTPTGNGDLDFAPHGVYPCAGEDRWIALAVDSDATWEELLAVAGSENLADPAFRRHRDRIANAKKLDEALAAWTRSQEAEHLMEHLQAAGIAAAVVRSTAEVMACPHLEERAWFRPIEHPDVGEKRYAGHSWRIDGLAERSDLPAPRLGEHSRELLAERLGLSSAEIDDLFERGVTGAVLA